MRKTLETFIHSIVLETVENETATDPMVYNEASLQHELAIFLRKNHRVKFEKPASDFINNWGKKQRLKDGKMGTVKKELDLLIDGQIAIELKFPAPKMSANESFWHFLEDIRFLEELMKYSDKITNAYFLAVITEHKASQFCELGHDSKNDTAYYELFQTFRNKTSSNCKIYNDKPYINPKHFRNGKKGKDEAKPFFNAILEFTHTYSIQWNPTENKKFRYLLLEIPKNSPKPQEF